MPRASRSNHGQVHARAGERCRPRRADALPLLLIALMTFLPASASAFDAEEQMQFADGMYVRGLYELALEEYLTLYRKAPTYERIDSAFYRIGECYRELGDEESAAAFYERVYRIFPGSELRFKAKLRRAEIFVGFEEYGQAAELLRSLVDEEPPVEVAAAAWYYLGYTQRRLGEVQRAEEAFDRLLERYPDSLFASYAAVELGELYRDREGLEDRMRELYRQAVRRPATPRVAAEAWFRLAELEFRTERYEASADAYETLLTEYPDDRRARESRLQAGWAYLRAERHQEALALVGETLRRGGVEKESAWLYLKANADRRLGQDAAARATYNELIRRFPDAPVADAAAYESALIAFDAGDHAAVVSRLQAMEPKPGTEQDVLWLIAESYAAQDRTEAAIENYRKLVGTYPDSKRAPMAGYRLAELHRKSNRLESASSQYRAMADAYPEHELAPEALLASAFCRSRLGQPAEALKDWSRLVRDYEGYGKMEDVLYQKGLAEMKLERDGDARATFERLLEQHPETGWAAKAHHWLGILYERVKDYPRAEQALRAALAEQPEAKLGDQVRFRLATVLQKADRLQEAGEILEGLVNSAHVQLSPALLEWLTRYLLELDAFPRAVTVAEAFAQRVDSPAWSQIAWYLLGQAREKTGARAAARRAYERALAEEANTREGAEAALRLGRLARDDQDYENATGYFEKLGERAQAADLGDLRARSYYELAKTAEEEANWTDAAKYYMGVAILFDDPTLAPESLYRAAAAFERLDQPERRQNALEELRTRYPQSDWAVRASAGENNGN